MLRIPTRIWKSGGKASDLFVLFAVLGLVFIGSSIPAEGIPKSDIFNYDKVIHIVEYFVVGVALFWSVRHSRRMHGPLGMLPFAGEKARIIAFIILGGLLWAISDEIHQSFVGRDCSILDLFADVFGLSIAALLYLTGTLKTALE